MGIDAKSIGLCIWKVLKLSIITSYRFLRKYPVFSGTSMSLLLLYVYLPFVFIVIVYSSPFLALAAVGAKFYWKKERPKPQDVKKQDVKVVENKKNEKQPSRSVSFKDDDIIIIRNNRTTISRQMSRRRNFKDRNRLDWDAQAASEKNEDIVSLTASLRELLGLTSEVEDKPKGMLDEKKSGSIQEEGSDDADKSISSDQSWSRPDWTSNSGSEEQSHKCDGSGGESMEEADDDDEDEAQEDRNKAVEWTKDDQKNLMDLGVSEIERNNRLESLMAKRRWRKLMRMEGGKSLIDPSPEIAPISVSRTEPSDHPSKDDSPMPGSAPPVLLPLRNPFDLPYDPLEEKPNLSGDSFHEEFTATQPKDMLYCRHESFALGSSIPSGPKQDRPDSVFGPYFGTTYRESEAPGYPRNRRQPKKGDHDRLVEQLLSLKGKSMPHKRSTQDLVEAEQAPNQEVNSMQLQSIADKETDNSTTQSQAEGIKNAQNIESELGKQSPVQIKNDATEAKPSESGVSSSDEDDVFNANIAGISVSLTSKWRNFPNALHPMKKSLASSLPKKLAGKELVYDSSTSAEDKAKIAEHLFNVTRRSSHSSNYPMASDMQAELSDIDSPRPPFNEFLTYDGDNEKENSSGSEDLWGASPRVGGVLEQQSSSRDVSNVGEEAKTEAGLSPSGTKIPENSLPNKIDDSDNKIQIRDSRGYKLSLECLEAEQLIETLRLHPTLEGLHKDVLENMKSIDVIDDETNSEYTDDISEKQSAYEGTSDAPEAVEERGKLNSIEEEEEEEKRGTTEVGSSGINQSSDYHNASHDQASSEYAAVSNSSSENPPEKDIITHSSSNSDHESSQEQSNPPGRSREDANELPTEASEGESDVLTCHKAAEERNSTEDTDGASENLAETIFSAEHPETLLTDQEATHHPQKSNDLDDVIVFEEEKKPQSAEGGEGESLDLIRREANMEPPKLPEPSQVTNSRNIEDTDGKSVKPSDDGIGSSKSDIPPTSAGQEPNDPLLQDSTSIINVMNETLMSEIMNEDKSKPVGHGEQESDVSIIVDPIPELMTTVAESNSRSMLDMEGENKDGTNAIQNAMGESGVLMVTVEKDTLVNHDHIMELPKPANSEDMASELNDVESQAYTREEPVPEASSKDTEGESKHSSEATLQASIKDSTGMD